MMMTKTRWVSCLIALLAVPAAESFAGTADFSVQLINSFDYPGSPPSTQPQKINDGNAVVGVFVESVTAGFVRFRNGHFSPPLIDPNDGAGLTQGRGINNSYTICGNYTDSGGISHGFFSHGSTFYDYDVPGASAFTVVLGLSNNGDFCGSDIPDATGVQSGFVSLGGSVTEFTVTDATATLAYQLNDSNEAVGYYIDFNGVTHGYMRDSSGTITSPIDPAGSTGTIVFGNNNAGYIVGRYSDASGVTHGFVFLPPDSYATFDFPGSTFTSLNGINNAGKIVGRYLDANGVEHGLFATLASGANGSISGTVPQRRPAQQGAVKAPPARVQVAQPAQ